MPFDGTVVNDVSLHDTLVETGVITFATHAPKIPEVFPPLSSVSVEVPDAWERMAMRRLRTGCWIGIAGSDVTQQFFRRRHAMPFDGTDSDTPFALVDYMIDYFSDEKHWCKKHYAIEHENQDTQYCLTGIMWFKEDRSYSDGKSLLILQSLHDAIKIRYPHIGYPVGDTRYTDENSIVMFNDHPDTTHVMILTILLDARSLLLGETIQPEPAKSKSIFRWMIGCR
jgi:hypothetical protein